MLGRNRLCKINIVIQDCDKSHDIAYCLPDVIKSSPLCWLGYSSVGYRESNGARFIPGVKLHFSLQVDKESFHHFSDFFEENVYGGVYI